MKFLQPSIERMLFGLLGTEVRFGSMNLSPLRGRIEVQNLTIAGTEPGKPVLSIRRIDAKVAVARALAGVLDIKSLLVEGPEIRVRRYPDGSFNFRMIPPSLGTPGEGQGGGSSSHDWQFDAESIQIVGGRFSYEHDQYHSTAEQISGDLKCHGGIIDVSLRIGSLGRRDIPVEFGAFELTGEMDDHNGLAGVATSPFRAEWRFADGLSMSIDCPGFASGRAAIELHGPLDIKRWQAAVPQNLLPPAVAALSFDGPVDADIRLDLSFAEGIQVREMHLRARLTSRRNPKLEIRMAYQPPKQKDE